VGTVIGNSNIFDYSNYSKILHVFIEVLPKLDKKKEILLKEAPFFRNLFELSLYLITKNSKVTYSTMEDMIETPKPLPLNFIPQTKYWKKILTGITDLKEKDTALGLSGNFNQPPVKPLMPHMEMNHVLQGLMSKFTLALKR
jgi:hypothetical protein